MRSDEDKFVIRGPDISIPADVKKLLNNSKNKEKIFKLKKQTWAEGRDENEDCTVYVAKGSSCVQIENWVLKQVPEI